MLRGIAPRAKSWAKAGGNCEDGSRAITGADQAESKARAARMISQPAWAVRHQGENDK